MTSINILAKIKWLAKKFIPISRHTPEMKPKRLIVEALKKLGVNLSSTQAYGSQKIVLELI